MKFVEGDEALAQFRAGLTGRRGLELLRDHGGRVLIQLPVGVGKSRFLDEITIEALVSGQHDLVIVLAPTRLILEEREHLRNRPAGYTVVNLRPRPSESCGVVRDKLWKKYEPAELGSLGRAEVCNACPLVGDCFWPSQYGRTLEGASIVYATHAHLKNSPGFLRRIQSWTRAENPLTLIDEFDFASKGFGTTVTAEELRRFAEALDHASPDCTDPAWHHERWVDLVTMIRDASTCDLQGSSWPTPPIDHEWAARVQRAGVDLHDDQFRFPAYRLANLSQSPIGTRRKGDQGEIEFATRPYIGDCLIFSGTTSLSFARSRLGDDVGSPFADHVFRHPGTRWFNIASSIGTSRHFSGNRIQILDFFALLMERRVSEGKRVLIVTKKQHAQQCRDGLEQRFRDWGIALEILGDGFTEASLSSLSAVPLITYGMIGTNLFEAFDCAYCLNSYYIDEKILDEGLQDMTRRDLRLRTAIETVGVPRRRRAGVADPADRYYDTARLAQPTLEFKEHGVVIQAVGRVRPFTRPREIITFQAGELPGVVYEEEFQTLGEVRRFFGIPTGQKWKAARQASRISELRKQGLTQVQTAEVLGITERTVRNHERHPEGTGKTPL